MCLDIREYILNIKPVLKGSQHPIVQEIKTYAMAEFPLLAHLSITSYPSLQRPLSYEQWLLNKGRTEHQSHVGRFLSTSSCQGDSIPSVWPNPSSCLAWSLIAGSKEHAVGIGGKNQQKEE